MEVKNVRQILEELREYFQDLMVGTVEDRLDTWYSDALLAFGNEATWVLHSPPRLHEFSRNQKTLFASSIETLARVCMLKPDNLSVCYKAVMERGYGSKGKSSHEWLELDDNVQVLVAPSIEQTAFITSSETNGNPKFFVVGAL